MKKVLLSTAILGSLFLGVVAPTTARVTVLHQNLNNARMVSTKYVYCSADCKQITPHDYDDYWGEKWVCRVCGRNIVS